MILAHSPWKLEGFPLAQQSAALYLTMVWINPSFSCAYKSLGTFVYSQESIQGKNWYQECESALIDYRLHTGSIWGRITPSRSNSGEKRINVRPKYPKHSFLLGFSRNPLQSIPLQLSDTGTGLCNLLDQVVLWEAGSIIYRGKTSFLKNL